MANAQLQLSPEENQFTRASAQLQLSSDEQPVIYQRTVTVDDQIHMSNSDSALHNASYLALNTAYEDLKHRYNELQERHKKCRSFKNSRQSLDDGVNEGTRWVPSGDMVPQGSPTRQLENEMGSNTLLQQLAKKDKEIEELKAKLQAKSDFECSVTELQQENDQLMKLNHDLTYENSNQLTKKIAELSQQLEVTKKELNVLQKDYQSLLQENDNFVKKNLLLEKQARGNTRSLPAEHLVNGIASPVEDGPSQDIGMDADDLQQLVVMSMSSKEEMSRLKERVWKLNEVVRILLRQQKDRNALPRKPDSLINGDASLHTGIGARPKVRTYVIHGNNVPLLPPEQETNASTKEDNALRDAKVHRTRPTQSRPKTKNSDFEADPLDITLIRPKSNIEYARHFNPQVAGKVKYTTHINLEELELEVPRNLKREKNDYRSEINLGGRSKDMKNRYPDLLRAAPEYDFNDDLSDIISRRPRDEDDIIPLPRGLGVRTESLEHLHDNDDYFNEDQLPRLNEIHDLSPDDDFKTLTDPTLNDHLEPMTLKTTLTEGSTLVPESPSWDSRNNRRTNPGQQLSSPNERTPLGPESPSWESRNNRRSQISPNHTQFALNGSPRPINIDRNECEPNARSYDNTQPQNVNLNTGQDKFTSQSRQGFAILNNDPLTGNKNIPSKNIYQGTEMTRMEGKSRIPEEHDDSMVQQICPICSESYSSSLPEFEAHVDSCISSSNGEDENDSIILQEREERVCPMCNEKFSDAVPQNEFEAHVNDHFDLNFVILANSDD